MSRKTNNSGENNNDNVEEGEADAESLGLLLGSRRRGAGRHASRHADDSASTDSDSDRDSDDSEADSTSDDAASETTEDGDHHTHLPLQHDVKYSTCGEGTPHTHTNASAAVSHLDHDRWGESEDGRGSERKAPNDSTRTNATKHASGRSTRGSIDASPAVPATPTEHTVHPQPRKVISSALDEVDQPLQFLDKVRTSIHKRVSPVKRNPQSWRHLLSPTLPALRARMLATVARMLVTSPQVVVEHKLIQMLWKYAFYEEMAVLRQILRHAGRVFQHMAEDKAQQEQESTAVAMLLRALLDEGHGSFTDLLAVLSSGAHTESVSAPLSPRQEEAEAECGHDAVWGSEDSATSAVDFLNPSTTPNPPLYYVETGQDYARLKVASSLHVILGDIERYKLDIKQAATIPMLMDEEYDANRAQERLGILLSSFHHYQHAHTLNPLSVTPVKQAVLVLSLAETQCLSDDVQQPPPSSSLKASSTSKSSSMPTRHRRLEVVAEDGERSGERIHFALLKSAALAKSLHFDHNLALIWEESLRCPSDTPPMPTAATEQQAAAALTDIRSFHHAHHHGFGMSLMSAWMDNDDHVVPDTPQVIADFLARLSDLTAATPVENFEHKANLFFSKFEESLSRVSEVLSPDHPNATELKDSISSADAPSLIAPGTLYHMTLACIGACCSISSASQGGPYFHDTVTTHSGTPSVPQHRQRRGEGMGAPDGHEQPSVPKNQLARFFFTHYIAQVARILKSLTRPTKLTAGYLRSVHLIVLFLETEAGALISAGSSLATSQQFWQAIARGVTSLLQAIPTYSLARELEDTRSGNVVLAESLDVMMITCCKRHEGIQQGLLRLTQADTHSSSDECRPTKPYLVPESNFIAAFRLRVASLIHWVSTISGLDMEKKNFRLRLDAQTTQCFTQHEQNQGEPRVRDTFSERLADVQATFEAQKLENDLSVLKKKAQLSTLIVDSATLLDHLPLLKKLLRCDLIHQVLVPRYVLARLDSLKKGESELARSARHASRWLKQVTLEMGSKVRIATPEITLDPIVCQALCINVPLRSDGSQQQLCEADDEIGRMYQPPTRPISFGVPDEENNSNRDDSESPAHALAVIDGEELEGIMCCAMGLVVSAGEVERSGGTRQEPFSKGIKDDMTIVSHSSRDEGKIRQLGFVHCTLRAIDDFLKNNNTPA